MGLYAELYAGQSGLARTMVSQVLRFCILMAVTRMQQGQREKPRILRVERPHPYRVSGAESKIVALVLVIFHRLMEDVIGRQRAQSFGDFL